MGTNQTTNIAKKIELKEGSQSSDYYNYINSIPTFNKLCLAQNLLKEMYSLKERFEENKEKMIGKISLNCYKFYKNKLYSKEVYDYFDSNNLEERNNYKLLVNPKFLQEKKYKCIYDFLFILRNNNMLTMKIINKCNPEYYKDLSYFIIHFFYEDTTNCSFFREEQLLFIYLLLEDKIINKLPLKLNSSIVKKDSDLYNKEINNSFLYHLFNSLSRKSDIRNYLCSVFTDSIQKLEEIRDTLSTEPNIILKRFEQLSSKNDSNENIINLNPNKNLIDENIFLKNNKRLKEAIRYSIIGVKKRISVSGSIPSGEKKISENNDVKTLLEKEEKKLENISTDKIKIDSFFNNEDISYMYICEQLNFYENIKEKSKKDFAMIEYLDILLNEITKDGEPVEIFSTILLKNELKMKKMNESHEDYLKLINKIKSNYDTITSFISSLLIIIRENLNSIPHIIKYIFKIVEELINVKYKNVKKEAFNYQLLIIKARILFGCMIIPMLNNPNYSGIFTDGIISQITKENLNIISKILKITISGSLFVVKNVGLTIFNKFIINLLSNIFDIIVEIDNDIILPNFITKLITELDNNKKDDKERNINYDYFNEKKDDTIQFQSICFSWKDLIILFNILKKNKDIFNNKFINNENEIEILNKIQSILQDSLNFFSENFEDNIKKKSFDYYLITKINYRKDFENRINAIIKDNFEILFQGQKNDESLRFKKCLTEVLAYVNYLQKEDFMIFIKRKENQTLNKTSDINQYNQNKRQQLYQNIAFESKKFHDKKVKVENQNDLIKLKNSLRKIGDLNKIEPKMSYFLLKRKSSIYKEILGIKEELDFKNEIFPIIVSKAMSEIYYNPTKGKSQRIIFCISYIQEHMDDLPVKYTQNNFRKIFLDILEEPEKLIKELQAKILNQFHKNIRNSEKLNLLASKDYIQIKNMERFSYAGQIFNKMIVNGNLEKHIKNKKIESIKLELNPNNNINNNFTAGTTNLDTIQSFINEMPDFKKYEPKENIIELEKKLKINDLINNYFKEINSLLKNQKIIPQLSADDVTLILYELENYVLIKLYDKLYPSTDSKEDKFFYKKCCRLSFIKPENLIKNKKMINENLLDISINYMSEMDKKLTPVDKIKIFIKALDVLKNSMTFNSGKTDLGLDDTLSFIIYIVLKSKQKNMYRNYNYCNLFINPELGKKQFGSMLTQLGMVINIINNMKYTELIGISKEQFGKDE